jgi:hypothetical protein
MTEVRLQADMIDVAVELAFWISLLLPFFLLTFWSWYKESWGRWMVTLDLLVSLALLPAIIHDIFNVKLHLGWLGWFDVAVILCIPVRTCFMSVAIYRLQRKKDA